MLNSYQYLSFELTGNVLKHSQAPERLLYEGVLDIVSMTRKTPKKFHGLIQALKKITDFAKSASDVAQQCAMPLFYNRHFRNLYAYALHGYWQSTDDLFVPEELDCLDGRAQAKEFLDVLRERLATSRDNPGLPPLIRHIKLLFKLEQDLHGLRDIEQATAEDHRERAFHLLDWLPAILGSAKPILANLFLQIGMHFQQAARLERRVAFKMADEQLALKMYLSAALGVGDHATPDVELTATVQSLRYLAAFQYTTPLLQEVIPALQRRALIMADIFPFFESPAPSVDVLRKENQSIQLMRRLLNTLVEILEYNRSHSDNIVLDHESSDVMYQVYEACLKNWFQEKYDPETERRFRLVLMEELLRDHDWTPFDVDQNIDTPWNMIDRDDEGWIKPSRLSPYARSTEFVKYRAIKGAQINHATGKIHLIMEPWSQRYAVSDQVFTESDVAEMLEKNLDQGIFSLDPVDADKPYHPFNVMRFEPPQLAESELFNTMLLTDYLLKFFTTYQEVQGGYPYGQRPVTSMIEHLPAYLRKIIDDFHQAPHSGAVHRFWIEAEAIDVTVSEEDNKEEEMSYVALGQLRMVVKKHRMVRDIHGELKDVSNEDEGWPIYVFTSRQWRELEVGFRRIDGRAMIFLDGTFRLRYWENGRMICAHRPNEPDEYEETLCRLYEVPRDRDGHVSPTSDTAALLYRITWDMAEETGLPHYYSPEFIFAHQFTRHYDEFAQYFPEFGRLKELSKISVLIRFLNGIRQSNQAHLDALNFILRGVSNVKPPDTDAYRQYQHNVQEVCEQVQSIFQKISRDVSSVALNRKWHQELTRIKNEIGALHFDRHSSQVNSACEELLRQTSQINPGIPSWRISREVVEPKRAEIAQQLSQMKQQSCREQLERIFSSMLSSSNGPRCINAFIQGNMEPLTEALVAHERSQAQKQLQPQFSGSSTRDIEQALEGNRSAMARIGRAQSKRQLTPHQQAKQRLESGFSDLGLGRDAKSSAVKGQCFWVPASVRHEVKEENAQEGLRRHSFFVYGGVRVQPRINVVQGRGVPRSLAMRSGGVRGGGLPGGAGRGGNNGARGGRVPFNTAKAWTKSARVKTAQLPKSGKIRFVPRKDYRPSKPLPRGRNNGFIDRFDNEWVKGKSRTHGQPHEWDIQLSSLGQKKLGWASRDGRHVNVSLDGRITHK